MITGSNKIACKGVSGLEMEASLAKSQNVRDGENNQGSDICTSWMENRHRIFICRPSDNREVCGPYKEKLELSREIEIKVCTWASISARSNSRNVLEIAPGRLAEEVAWELGTNSGLSF